MVKTIIFDLDGVLVYTDKFHYLAWKKMADRIGVPFDETINNRLRGVSRMDSLEIILERYDGQMTQAEKEALAEEKNNLYRQLEEKNGYYKEFLKNMSPADVRPEIRGMLKELHERGYHLAIGSSSKNTKFILAQTQLTDDFDAISDGTNITKSKPDPEVFLKAAEYTQTTPGNCLVVEDAIAGIDAAKAGGMLAAGVGEAKTYEKTDYPMDKVEDLLTLPL